MWRPVHRGKGQPCVRFSLCTEDPFVGSQCQRIKSAGNDEPGVENQGLNRQGMSFVGGKPYQGVVWARAPKPALLRVAIDSVDGTQALDATTVKVDQADWQRLEFQLTPSANCDRGKLTISLQNYATVDLGYVFLQPGDWGRFKGLPVRKDVAEALVAEGLTVLRYGGSMINHPEYRWKKMIGPRDRRPPYHGTWYPWSTNGWGIIDFLAFCEAAGFLPIPDFNIDETPQDMADFVEYVNGPADSPWGRRRAADGHPAPFGLKHIQLGNEEAVNDAHWQKFQPLAEAIWHADPTITPVVGDFEYRQHIADPYHFAGSPVIKSLAAHKQILDFARERKQPVWFDVHIWNDNLRDCDLELEVLAELIEHLGRLSPGADFKVCVFEENANNHLLRRGLAHARTVGGLARFGQRVPIVCAANCLQVDGQNDNGWDQGLLFLSPEKTWAQPPYYVTQLISRHNLPGLLKVDCQSPAGALDATARRSARRQAARAAGGQQRRRVAAGPAAAGRFHAGVGQRPRRRDFGSARCPQHGGRARPHRAPGAYLAIARGSGGARIRIPSVLVHGAGVRVSETPPSRDDPIIHQGPSALKVRQSPAQGEPSDSLGIRSNVRPSAAPRGRRTARKPNGWVQ